MFHSAFHSAEKISDAELEIMKVIWSESTSVTYTQIRNALDKGNGWDTSTIRTLIQRLVHKGILKQEKKEVYYYSATISESEFIKARTKDFLQKVYGGDAKHLIATMLHTDVLTKEEIDEVKEFWKKGRGLDE